MSSRLKIFIGLMLVLGLASTLFLVVGMVRYGGPAGLALRVRSEVAAYRAHPEFVPTPLPLSTRVLAAPPRPLVDASASTPFLLATQSVSAVSVPPETSTPPPAPPTVSARALGHASIQITATPALAAPVGIESARVPVPGDPPGAPLQSAALPVPADKPAAAQVELTGTTHIWQKWNNCGPATLSMYLSYYGIAVDQAPLAEVLKGNADDKNVSPDALAAFVRTKGLRALVRVNGDADLLRRLLTNGVPVIVETWLEPKPNDGMGHYRLLTGYNDTTRQWTVYDSYVSTGVKTNEAYSGIKLPYDEMSTLWTVFDRTYVVVYPNAFAPLVEGILGADVNDAAMWQRALLHGQEEVKQRPGDAFAWFNLGTDWVALGRYDDAVAAYGKARVIGLPWRMLWYQFGPFRAYYETGNYDELVAVADATIRTAGNIEETYYWRGLALAARGDPAAARAALQRASELNSHYAEATTALAALKP